MADSLSEGDILEAVARHIGRPGQGPQLRRAGADITPLPMLDLRIVRSVETRSTQLESRSGKYDISGRETYEGELRDHPVEPPKDPARWRKVELVLNGSVRTVDCGCDEGGSPVRAAGPRGNCAARPDRCVRPARVWSRAPGATARANAARTARRTDRRGGGTRPDVPPV
ncbi:hypothetical protein [Streptomyces sp. NBC_00046]|uniref:hypothetical protein n=1 Tax=unclassified Streptomyces TaxID=2593676 RepID=UPI00324D6718